MKKLLLSSLVLSAAVLPAFVSVSADETASTTGQPAVVAKPTKEDKKAEDMKRLEEIKKTEEAKAAKAKAEREAINPLTDTSVDLTIKDILDASKKVKTEPAVVEQKPEIPLFNPDGTFFMLDGQEVTLKNYKEGDNQLLFKGRHASYLLTFVVKDNEAVLTKLPQVVQDGKKEDGWVKKDGEWYYFEKGKSVTNAWRFINGHWYLFTPGGQMKFQDWVQQNGHWYYLNDNGAMETNWFKDYTGTWYYANKSGEMQTGWLNDKGTWYYLKSSGAMQSNGWFQVGDKWYYVNESGALLVNTTTPDGYKVNHSGEWVK